MKLEMVDNNKLKIMFDYIELEENNISIHSFLSNSIEAQKFFLAILDIANEDLGFNQTHSNLSYETISFDNKFFVIIVTKDNNTTISNTSKDSYIIEENKLLYKLRDTNELFYFCDFLKTIFPNLNFNSSLYQYENLYFLKINLENLDNNTKKLIIFQLSEFKNNLHLSEMAFKRFEEFAEIIIKNNAIQVL